jgi:hypothetical protein
MRIKNMQFNRQVGFSMCAKSVWELLMIFFMPIESWFTQRWKKRKNPLWNAKIFRTCSDCTVFLFTSTLNSGRVEDVWDFYPRRGIFPHCWRFLVFNSKLSDNGMKTPLRIQMWNSVSFANLFCIHHSFLTCPNKSLRIIPEMTKSSIFNCF